jgi:tRNA pseudouridine38-40 synthase
MLKIALKVAYLGNDFHGFARQPDLPTIEGELINALTESRVIDEPSDAGYSIAGRTDRGVHALGNVVAFRTESKVNVNQINDLLPVSIKILAQASVHYGFKPRFALQRHYRYLLAKDPFEEDWDVEKMREAGKVFIGTHDFSNFTKRSERNPIRTIDHLEVSNNNDILSFDVKGKSFLWNMVRKIITALINVGRGEIEIKDIVEFLNPQNKVFITPVPPEGLILMDVTYDNVKFVEDPYARKLFLSVLMKSYMNTRNHSAAYQEMIKHLNHNKNYTSYLFNDLKVLK